jgi:CheY-like chemotaxis protein
MKKIKILVADDRNASAETIIRYALPLASDLAEGSPEHLDAIYATLDIRHINTVGEAVHHMEQNPDEPFDLAFVDIDFSETDRDESDRRFLGFPANRRGLNLLRVLRNDFPQTKVKVHTRYGTTLDVYKSLKEQGIELDDLYDLMTDGDIIAVRQNLAAQFPQLLQTVAQNVYYHATQEANRKTALDAELQQYARERALDRPIQSLSGFTLRTLLAGWAQATLSAEEKTIEVALPRSLDEALATIGILREHPNQNEDAFNPAGNLRRLHPRTGAPEIGYQRLMALRTRADYPAIRQEIEATALAIVQEFLTKGWGQASEADIRAGRLEGFEQAFAPMNTPPYPVGLDYHLGQVLRDDEAAAQDALKRVLIGRLIFLSLYTLKNAGICFAQLNTQRVFDIAVLAAIRNNPTDVGGYHEETVDHYFSILLGFKKLPRRAVILPESILPEEHAWMNRLPQHFRAHQHN